MPCVPVPGDWGWVGASLCSSAPLSAIGSLCLEDPEWLRISANSPALTSASSRCCQLYLTTEGQSGLLRGSLLAILPQLWRLTSLWGPGVLQRGYCQFSSPALSLHQALCICALGAVSLSPPALPLIFTWALSEVLWQKVVEGMETLFSAGTPWDSKLSWQSSLDL